MSALGLGGGAPGRSLNSTPLATVANRSTASIIANPVPMHTLGPAPKGTYTPPGPIPFNAPFAIASDGSFSAFASSVTASVASLVPPGVPPGSSHLSGLNASGSFQFLASRCRRYGLTRIVVPSGKSYPPTTTSSAQHRPTMYAGGSRRIVSNTVASTYGMRATSAADGTFSSGSGPSVDVASAATLSATSGCCARSAQHHDRRIADVSCPATMSVMSSSRRDVSSIPAPSPSSPSSRASRRRSSKSGEAADASSEDDFVERPSSVRASASTQSFRSGSQFTLGTRRFTSTVVVDRSSLDVSRDDSPLLARLSAMRPYTAASSLATAALYRTLSGIGTHSGTMKPVLDRFPKNSKASLIAALISIARAPRTSAPKSASATTRRVRVLKSSYTSRTDRVFHSFERSDTPAFAMEEA